MQKCSIICIIISAMLLLSGCSGEKEKSENKEPITFSTVTVENSAATEFPETVSVVTTAEETEEPEIIVYITNSGSKYHREDCVYLTYSKIPVNLYDLDTGFYKPCGICRP